MEFEVTEHFAQRWSNVPKMARQTYLNDLQRVLKLFQTDCSLSKWRIEDQAAQKQSSDLIAQAYASLKIQLQAEAKVRRQKQLEQRLNARRAAQQQAALALLEDEKQRFIAQTEQLQLIQQQITAETKQYISRYFYIKNDSIKIEIEPFFNLNNLNLSQNLTEFKQDLQQKSIDFIEKNLVHVQNQLQQIAQKEVEHLIKIKTNTLS